MCKVNLHKNVINDKGGCMANRFNDVKLNTFSLWTDMVVVCPKCGKAGIVHFDKDHNVAIFQCEAIINYLINQGFYLRCFWKF